MTTTYDAQIIYPDPASHIHDWLQDLALELGNAARDRQRYAKQGVELCDRVLEQFTAEEEHFRQCFRADLGEFYVLDGRFDEGERILLALIKDCPNTALGYVRLSDLLASPNADDDDLHRALKLLHSAIDSPAADASSFSLEARIQDIQERLEKRKR